MAKNRRYMMDEDFDEKDRIDDNDIDDYYVQEAPVKRSRKSNKNKRSAGIIAAVIVVCVLVAGGIGLVTLIDKYTPNKTKITFEDYYREHGYISEAGASEADNYGKASVTAFMLLNYRFVLLMGIIGSTSLAKRLSNRILPDGTLRREILAALFVFLILGICMAYLINSSYNPFLYFRF